MNNMITINGKSYNGRNITITNNKVIIDGKEVKSDDKIINIVVTGDIESIKADSCDAITVTGDVGDVGTMSGDVKIKGNVTGNVGTMSGDVRADSILGNVKTMSGDIN